ncbi:MAG: Trk system potassium transporter TrkA [Lachnospiraceae bacterium]|nr:Trk system potassium transporter TrkA [Lachnospiraceae bacterium]
MNIIIVGCGKVGYAIASQLTDEGHEITIIDTDAARLERACSSLDTNGVVGNGTAYSVLLEAGINEADVFIAVTKHDEVNLLSCLIAKKANNCHTIARVKKPEYYEEIEFLSNELGISYAFNPELMTAKEIFMLIHTPAVLEIDSFAKNSVNLMKAKIPEGSSLDNISLREMSESINSEVLVCIVERNKASIIPSGDFVLKAGDSISFVLAMKQAYSFFKEIGLKAKPIRNVVIAGGGTISYYLAKYLHDKTRVFVKIIEPDKSVCERLSSQLPHCMVINGDINDTDLLEQEDISDADALIGLSEIDEENIVFALYAAKMSKSKIITKINRSEFYGAFVDLPASLICPRNITAESMIGFVRHLENSYGNVDAVYKLNNNAVEALQFSIDKSSKVVGTPLRSLNLKDNLLICSISRGSQAIKPRGNDTLEPGDTIVVVTTHKGLHSVDDILQK